MRLRISENSRRRKNDIISELESQGYDIIDSGYEDYRPYEEKWKSKGYDVKSFYMKSDTRGLKMWVMYGKQKSDMKPLKPSEGESDRFFNDVISLIRSEYEVSGNDITIDIRIPIKPKDFTDVWYKVWDYLKSLGISVYGISGRKEGSMSIVRMNFSGSDKCFEKLY